MGMVYTFTRVDPADAERISAEPGIAWDVLEALRHREGEPRGDLDKAWDGLRHLLAAAEVVEDLLRENEAVSPGDETCTVVWSVEDVATTARTLAAAPFDVLAGHFDAAAMDEEGIYPEIWESDWSLDYLRENYDALREFFSYAAGVGSAAVARFE
ncbi:DUF1877 family protein [Nocardia sp. NPDC056064]|uniref:DUF1877 family protein n=1 Tax=Nocardia sp. NPDC056064 TaxID=3345701 RepID=UPI0035E33B81